MLYVLGPLGQLTALNLADGSKKWSYQTGPAVLGETGSNGSPSIGADGTVYIVASDTLHHTSALYAMDPSTGQPKWTYALPGTSNADTATPSIGPDGPIYFFE